MSTLWNTYAFFVLYANIDEFDATKYTLEYGKLSVMDQLAAFEAQHPDSETVDDNLENYRIPEAARALQDFVDEHEQLVCAPRAANGSGSKEMTQDKINAYMTLYTALVTVAKASAPMIPFMAEDIYRNLVCNLDQNAPESVHLCDFPAADTACIDRELEDNMELVLEIVTLGRAARNGANMKNRQPLGKMYVKAARELSDYYVQIIEEVTECQGCQLRAG